MGGYYSADSLVNNGTITSASGQTPFGQQLVNNGTITANGATVNLGGFVHRRGAGQLQRQRRRGELGGHAEQRGTTLALSPAIGAWRLLGGRSPAGPSPVPVGQRWP